jgi:DNA polymerase (family X)
MSNSEIADIIELTGKLLDLHDKDEMRSKTYLSSVFTLERLETDLSTMKSSEISAIRGFGKLMTKNIEEILQTGTLQELTDLVAQTPEGIFDIFKVKGLGVKKIKVLWYELGLDNINDLKIACENGKIALQKGFGQKTQDSILESLAFLQAQQGKLRMDKALFLSQDILAVLSSMYEGVEEVGQVIRASQTVDLLQFIVPKDGFGSLKLPEPFEIDVKESSPSMWRGTFNKNQIKIEIEKVASKDLVWKRMLRNSAEEHLKLKNDNGEHLLQFVQNSNLSSESDIYEAFGSSYIIPEMREGFTELDWIKSNKNEQIVTWDSLKGTLHNHSTYSDGKNTLKQMADYAKEIGLTYFGIADHSQTATYASGLKPETVMKQHEEINLLNAGYLDFKIIKGIESDILPNGDLDYENDVLASFDYVVASVHSVLNMDIDRATQRLIKAIENPYTSILGHLSGRLLLSREGYPLHYQKIIDACAANKVVMELNASPYRLDIDWRYIEACLNKGVMISINPDAHTMHGLLDMHYGVKVARKAGLSSEMTLNCKSYVELMKVFNKK